MCGHPFVGPVGERQFEKVQSELGSGKVPNCECVFVNRGKGLYLPEYVDDFQTGWEDRKHNRFAPDFLFSTCFGLRLFWFWVVVFFGVRGRFQVVWNVNGHSTKSVRKCMSHTSHGHEGYVVNRMTTHGQYVARCKTC